MNNLNCTRCGWLWYNFTSIRILHSYTENNGDGREREREWKILAQFPPVCYIQRLNIIAPRARSYRNSIWRASYSQRRSEELEEISSSDTDRWSERANVERNAPADSAASMSHSLDADSEEPTIVPPEISSGFWRIDRRRSHCTTTKRHRRDRRHSAGKSPIGVVYVSK